MYIIFAGGKFRAKSQFANIAKISSTRKIGVIQYSTTTTLGSLCTKTSVAQCARVKDFCCVVDAITQRSSFVVVLPYKNFCWLQSANVR